MELLICHGERERGREEDREKEREKEGVREEETGGKRGKIQIKYF